jgi:hypothetical protein
LVRAMPPVHVETLPVQLVFAPWPPLERYGYGDPDGRTLPPKPSAGHIEEVNAVPGSGVHAVCATAAQTDKH